jgi:hypothetical protein
VSCARFRGTDKSQFIDRIDIEGSILDAVKDVPKFIRLNTRLLSRIESFKRQDILNLNGQNSGLPSELFFIPILKRSRAKQQMTL